MLVDDHMLQCDGFGNESSWEVIVNRDDWKLMFKSAKIVAINTGGLGWTQSFMLKSYRLSDCISNIYHFGNIIVGEASGTWGFWLVFAEICVFKSFY